MIKLGPAGLGSPAEKGVEELHKLKLDACEVAFTYKVYMSNAEAKKIGELAKKLNVSLSIHAPYYINLNSEDKKKLEASKKRILQSCERGNYMHASCVVFHPGYYGKDNPEVTYQNIKKAILEIQNEIKKHNWNIKLAPETTGKVNVFGSIDEILRLIKETHCSFCLDFAHVKARTQGKTSYEEMLSKFKDHTVHSHFSGIEYTSKGERNHKTTPLDELKKLISAIKKAKVNITLINESPTPIEDSLKTKKLI